MNRLFELIFWGMMMILMIMIMIMMTTMVMMMAVMVTIGMLLIDVFPLCKRIKLKASILHDPFPAKIQAFSSQLQSLDVLPRYP